MFRSAVLTFRSIKNNLGTIKCTWTDVEEINGSTVSQYRALDIRAVDSLIGDVNKDGKISAVDMT